MKLPKTLLVAFFFILSLKSFSQKDTLESDLFYVSQNLVAWHTILNDNYQFNDTADQKYKRFKEDLNQGDFLDSLIFLFKSKNDSISPINYNFLNKKKFLVLNQAYYELLRDTSKINTLIERIRSSITNNINTLDSISNNDKRDSIEFINHDIRLSQLSLRSELNYLLRLSKNSQLQTENIHLKEDSKFKESLNFQISEATDNFDFSFSDIEIPQYKIPSQNDMIDALAIFIANRFKEEVALTFIDKFRNNIATDSILKIIFPRTYKMLNSIQIYSNPSFGKSWKEAFAYDLATIQQNIKQSVLKSCSKKQSRCDENHSKSLFLKDQICYYATIIEILDEIKQGTNFFDLIELTIKNNGLCEKKVSYKLLKLVNYFNNNLRTYNSTHYFPKISDWNKIQNSYFGEKYINHYLHSDLKSILGEDYDTTRVKKRIPYIIVKYNRLEQVLRELATNSDQGKGNGVSNLYQYWNAIEDLISEISTLFEEEGEIVKYIEVIHTAIEIQKSIEAKNFGSMVNHSSHLLQLLINQSKPINNTDFEIFIRKKYKEKPNNYKVLYNAYKAFDTINIKRINNKKEYKQIKKEYFKKEYFNDMFQPQKKLFFLRYQDTIIAYHRDSIIITCNSDTIDLDKAFTKIDEKIQIHVKEKDTIYSFNDTIKQSIILSILISISDNNNKDFISYYLYTKLFQYSDQDSIYILNNSSIVLDHIINTLSFIVDILTVENSKDLSKLITSKAAPVSSYKIKRNNRFSIDLNSFPQLYAGVEVTKKKLFFKEEVDNSWAGVTGFSCPIGVSLSWGTKSKCNSPLSLKRSSYIKKNGQYKYLKGNSNSILLSIIDIGAVVSFRITNGEEPSLPKKIVFEQFLAPGIYYMHGIKKTPLVFTIGTQFTPKLRSFGEEETELFGAIRFSAGIAFDIPLYNVYHFTKRQSRIYSDL